VRTVALAFPSCRWGSDAWSRVKAFPNCKAVDAKEHGNAKNAQGDARHGAQRATVLDRQAIRLTRAGVATTTAWSARSDQERGLREVPCSVERIAGTATNARP
jgi:hypothetical protein